MNCIHCGGNHYSDYCLGYNSDSMNQSMSDFNSGLEQLSNLNERALEQASESYDALIDSNERISNDLRDVGSDISGSINSSTLVNEEGYEKISDSIKQAGNDAMIGSIVAGKMISSALIGIGAIMLFREQMEQIRHTERLKLDEEKSDAGKARRELKAASALLFANAPKQAMTHIQNSLNLYPSSAETFRLRSIIESGQGNHEQAIISLKAGLKLAEERELFPSFQNIDNSIPNNYFENVVTSILTQLTQEFAITDNLNDAMNSLDYGLNILPNNSDLHFQRIRILSKTSLWETNFEEYISELIELSPTHYNILYSDLQLQIKRNEIRKVLRAIRTENEIQLENKFQALTILTNGNSKALKKIISEGKPEELSFKTLISQTEFLKTQVIKQTNKKK
jgi:tetratricopeptide (TPR) repeat protein